MTNCHDTVQVTDFVLSRFTTTYSKISNRIVVIAFLQIIFIYFDIARIRSATLGSTIKCDKT